MTHGIQIRPYALSDLESFFEAVMESQNALTPWMPWCHANYGRDDAAKWVQSRPGAWERNESWSFLIVDSNDRLLGGVGLHRLDLQNGVAEVGYWVRQSEVRKGIATAAVGLACDWAAREQKFRRFEILAALDNLASQRVATRAGFALEGTLRGRILLRGTPVDCRLFGRVVASAVGG